MQAWTFDDIWLIPQYSEVESRNDVNIDSYITPNHRCTSPIIAASMDTVCGPRMVKTLVEHELGNGVLHRFATEHERLTMVEDISKITHDHGCPTCVAIGVKDTSSFVHELVTAGADILVLDVAHGHHKLVGDKLYEIAGLTSNQGRRVEIIAGNVATGEGAVFLADHGADVIKVGIGPGSICTTRLVTGHGVPQVTALQDVRETLNNSGYEDTLIMADGGIRTSGDIVKALVVGADTVMVGSLLAGTDETPGEVFVDRDNYKYKMYRGMASVTAQTDRFGGVRVVAEGVSGVVSYKGSVIPIVQELIGGIKSGMSYSGVKNIIDLQATGKYVVGTFAGAQEARTRI